MQEELTIKKYSETAFSCAVYPNCGMGNLSYPALGLCGEAGEVAEKVKKILRDKAGVVDDEARFAIAKELGDVMWYVNALCKELSLDLETVMLGNIRKLLDRKERGVLQGSGDDR